MRHTHTHNSFDNLKTYNRLYSTNSYPLLSCDSLFLVYLNLCVIALEKGSSKIVANNCAHLQRIWKENKIVNGIESNFINSWWLATDSEILDNACVPQIKIPLIGDDNNAHCSFTFCYDRQKHILPPILLCLHTKMSKFIGRTRRKGEIADCMRNVCFSHVHWRKVSHHTIRWIGDLHDNSFLCVIKIIQFKRYYRVSSAYTIHSSNWQFCCQRAIFTSKLN